jgi:hypothetical protein
LTNPTALAIDSRLSIPATELLFFPKIQAALFYGGGGGGGVV